MNPGYFADTEYIDYFYDGLSPWAMDYLAALQGFPRSDLAGEFHYCELGCGTGLSLCIHAAANPEGRFYGVDLNREHIQRALQTAQAGQLANVTFLEEDFTRLLERDLPRFDVIALHGVYSWVSPAIRRELQGFIAHRLQPGGKVYVSYNALPGWAQQSPIRQIMATHVDGMPGSTLDKVAKGVAHLKLLLEAGAPSLHSSPQVKALVEHILVSDPRYVAHEYFTPFWEPYYFQQVCTDMTRVGLTYLGCLPMPLNYGGFCLPKELQGFFQGLPTREAFETHKDLVLNTVFRRDVYCLRQPPPEPEQPLANVTLASVRAREDFTFHFEVKANAIDLDGVIFPLLADLLAGNRMAVADVLRHETLAAYPPEEIIQGLECLVAAGQLQPVPPGPVPRASGLSALNRHLLERDLATARSVSLACPWIGTGLTLPQADALIVYGIQEAGLDGATGWIEAWGRGHQLELKGADGSGDLERQVRERARHLPLAQLGL